MDIPLVNTNVISITFLNYMPKLHNIKFTKQSKSMLYATRSLWMVRGERPRFLLDGPVQKVSEASVPHSDCRPETHIAILMSRILSKCKPHLNNKHIKAIISHKAKTLIYNDQTCLIMTAPLPYIHCCDIIITII